MANNEALEVLNFWFDPEIADLRFKKDLDFDKKIIDKFSTLHNRAALGELENWRKTPKGCLAEIILLDQFSRNIYRDSPKAFAFDKQAIDLAKDAIRRGIDNKLNQDEKWFLYLPFMHSEEKEDHVIAMDLFTKLGNDYVLDFEIRHKEIIDRFGRYPHRNAILGRQSTPEEIEFLKDPKNSF